MPVMTPVAVVGMSARLPGAPDLRAFWRLLQEGRDAVDQVPAERWNWRDYDSQLTTGDETTYCQRGGFIQYVDRFDARFFGILPREAQSMDPQQRLFLQATWAALEDAGYAPSQLAKRRVGVFVGVGHADYPALMRRDGVPSDAWRGTGIALTAIANRVSYCLDLHGPSESIDTACSSSLVALHRARQALQDGECDLAIVGGVNLLLGPELFIAFAKAGMLSHAGHCQTFAASADGYVRGEGVAALVLAPLAAAQANGDFIYGQVCASAQNHGGRAHSFTAPNPKAQTEVIARAWQHAGYSPAQARLIETHGTGTPLGDPIEINALKKALPATDALTPIALGALKSQIGHLEAAAGIASVIKSLLCLQHRQVVGNLHHAALNPQIELTDSPFYLPDATRPLGEQDGPLLAGVSAFGFGGVNAHVVLKAADEHSSPAVPEGQPYLVLLSAKDEDGLRARARQLLAAFDEPLPDASGALRQALDERLRYLLGLMPSDGVATRLAELKVDAEDFVSCLEQALDALQLDVPIDAWRGAVSLEQVVERLVGEAVVQPAQAVRLESLTVLPAELPASLAAIARSLLEGRDAMVRRLAVVVDSHAELFERLRAYLRSAACPPDTLWHSADELPASPAPAAGNGRADRAALQRWAAHWVAGKVPSPNWATLYGDEPRPHKFPLPAYPWRLERVWYAAAVAPTAPVSAAQAWLDCWAPGTALPGSCMALAALVEHAAAQDSVLHWSEVCFGPPVALAPSDTLHFTRARQHWQVSVEGQVLLQVETPAAAPALQALRSTTEGVQVTLGAELDGHRLWAALLHTLITRSTGPSLPYRIRTLTLDPQALRDARQLSIERQGTAFDVALCTADGRCALRLEGVQMCSFEPLRQQVSA